MHAPAAVWQSIVPWVRNSFSPSRSGRGRRLGNGLLGKHRDTRNSRRQHAKPRGPDAMHSRQSMVSPPTERPLILPSCRSRCQRSNQTVPARPERVPLARVARRRSLKLSPLHRRGVLVTLPPQHSAPRRSPPPPPRKPTSASAPQLGPHRAQIRQWLTEDLSPDPPNPRPDSAAGTRKQVPL